MKQILKVKERKTQKIFDCDVEAVDLNNNGKYVMRYNIGINGHSEWSFIHAIYDNDAFNERYEVIGTTER